MPNSVQMHFHHSPLPFPSHSPRSCHFCPGAHPSPGSLEPCSALHPPCVLFFPTPFAHLSFLTAYTHSPVSSILKSPCPTPSSSRWVISLLSKSSWECVPCVQTTGLLLRDRTWLSPWWHTYTAPVEALCDLPQSQGHGHLPVLASPDCSFGQHWPFLLSFLTLTPPSLSLTLLFGPASYFPDHLFPVTADISSSAYLIHASFRQGSWWPHPPMWHKWPHTHSLCSSGKTSVPAF